MNIRYQDLISLSSVQQVALKNFKFAYLKYKNVTIVIRRPAIEMPHPIHVMIWSSRGLLCVCETSNRMAKFVMWLHSHTTSCAVVALATSRQPLLLHLPYTPSILVAVRKHWYNKIITQSAHDVVFTLYQRCLDVNNVVTTLKRRRVFAGKVEQISKILLFVHTPRWMKHQKRNQEKKHTSSEIPKTAQIVTSNTFVRIRPLET